MKSSLLRGGAPNEKRHEELTEDSVGLATSHLEIMSRSFVFEYAQTRFVLPLFLFCKDLPTHSANARFQAQAADNLF